MALRRFDHVFASPQLGVRSCDYVHEWRERALSDHSAVEVTFDAVDFGSPATQADCQTQRPSRT